MSYVRVNIADAQGSVSGDLHGSMTDPLVAALTAEPESIDEFKTAFQRFVKAESDWSPFRGFVASPNLEPYDAGILCIDLAARLIGVESTYSSPSAEGNVRVPNELSENDFADDQGDIYVPYRLPDDWRIVYSIPEYEGLAVRRREERAADRPFDARPVLFGRPMVTFMVSELLAAEDLEDEELFSNIHAKWLVSPREDLNGKTPRQVLLEKQDSISFDLQSRELQYSFTKLCPRPIPSDSFAYINAGFGIHEAVMYYDLIRVLLYDSYERLKSESPFEQESEVERLLIVKDIWLNSPDPESSGRVPADVIETERKRLNLTMSAQECLIDDDCPICVAMYEDFDTPGFWHYDGCNMDDRFEFSFHKTREEWDEEKLEYERFNREFAEGKWANDLEADDLLTADEDPF